MRKQGLEDQSMRDCDFIKFERTESAVQLIDAPRTRPENPR